MKAVRFHQQGGLEVLKYEIAPDPKPDTEEVLLRVRAASVNHVDLWVRTLYQVASFPHIPGSDAAGEIVELGHGVSNFSVGDRVVVYPGIPCGHCEYCLAGEDSACLNFGIFGVKTDGAYAELTVAKASNLLPIPNGISCEEAAAFPVTYITAWHSLITRAGLRAGETVLIHGAGSGVGTAAIQIAKLAGAKVIATSGSKEKREKAKSMGAEEALDYHYVKWPEKVRELTGGRGVEVVFDFIGPATFTGSIASLAKLGRLVSCGATTGADINFDLRNLYSRQISIIGAMLGSRAEFVLLLRLLADGELKPVIDRVMPLSEAAEAHRLMEQAGQFGKIVLKP